MAILDRLKHAWNAFLNKDPTPNYSYGPTYGFRPDRSRLTRGHERSLINTIINRISVDSASIPIKHVKLDNNNRYIETIDSGLNYCLNVEANKDQTGRGLRQDLISTMLDEGCCALVPIDTTIDPKNSASYRIDSMRIGHITQWYPDHIRVRIYNDRTGLQEEVVVPKSIAGIFENPFYSIMNEPNSTMQRLIRKLDLLDIVDEHNGSGKLDLIIQLPYIIKSEARKKQAEDRRMEIENQLANSKYGVVYTDGTEHVTQLNRPVENNLLSQIESLTSMLFSQLGLTSTILDGTADENTMNNYYNRTVEPIITVVVDEIKRKFLSKTARTQKQSIESFRDPFKLVSVSNLAEMSDKLTRNEILTANEVRQIIGLPPASDPNADALRNKNISASDDVPLYDVDGNIIREPSMDDSNNLEKGRIQNEY